MLVLMSLYMSQASLHSFVLPFVCPYAYAYAASVNQAVTRCNYSCINNLSHRVTCCAMVKIVAQSRIGFYFLKRLQQLFQRCIV